MANESDNSIMNVNEDNLNISYTCGVCETIFNQDDLARHPCFEGYNHYIIDDNFYCYPQCENGDIVRNSLMADGTEAVVVTPHEVNDVHSQHNKSIINFEAKKIAMEEQLIDEVYRRPGLWNFKLPLVERSPQIKKKLWEEVFAAMDGTLSIDMLKRKWKSLSDSFRVHSKKDQQAASGSAATSGKKLTISNIEPPEVDESHSDSLEMASLYDSSSSGRGSRQAG